MLVRAQGSRWAVVAVWQKVASSAHGVRAAVDVPVMLKLAIHVNDGKNGANQGHI